jgi:hypothetical protein
VLLITRFTFLKILPKTQSQRLRREFNVATPKILISTKLPN